MDKAARAHRHYLRGGEHKVAGRLVLAETEFRRAVALAPAEPRFQYALGITLLGQGRCLEGWPLFERRHEVPEFRSRKPDLPFTSWAGEDLSGKRLLIWPEQGFGDQIQSARFAPSLASRGAQVTLLCSPALVRLFEPLGVEVIAASGAVSFPDPDYWVMCMSIAGRLGLEVDQWPANPYLKGSAGPRGAFLRIGIAVQGDPRHPNDQMRSLHGSEAAQLHRLEGEVVDLSPAATGAKDFQDTADIIAGLDLVIAVDTSIAHLAGAMGKPCWVMIPAFNTDWRWLQGRTDSPWYPSMRLFRQSVPGDWSEVLQAIRRAIPVFGDWRERRPENV